LHVLSVFGRKSKGRAKREDSDFGSVVRRIKVRVRLSFNNNRLYNFDFGFNMVFSGNWGFGGLGFGV